MATLATFQKKLSRIANRKTLEKLLLQSIRETQKIAISLQKQQLDEGYSSENEELGRYSRATELEYLFGKGRKPNKPKKEGELYNFDDTGDFLKGIKLVFTKNDATFWSTDSKTPFLIEKYDNLLGLDEYNLKNYILNSVVPIFSSKIRKNLGIP